MPKRNPQELITEADSAANDIALAKAKAEAVQWKAKHREAVASAVAAERQLDAMLVMKNKPPVGRTLPILKRSKSAGVAVIAPATDWHVEEQIDPAAVNGKNNFNLAEAENRINRFYFKVLELIDWQNSLAPVVELWHPLLGNLMSGFLHEELAETNSLSPTEACVFLREMLSSGIDLWLNNTKLPIFCPCTVGNHGRTTQKMRIKTSCRNSFEWLLYKTLEKQYEKNRRVVFQVCHGYHNIQEIVGRKVRFHHGDGLRYQGGVGGLSIPVNKAIAQWNKSTPVDFDIFGHWHTFSWNYNNWISCGSLMGFSEYSLSIKADYQAPTQTFIVLDRNYGVTSALPVFLVPSNRKVREESGK